MPSKGRSYKNPGKEGIPKKKIKPVKKPVKKVRNPKKKK